MKVLVIQRGALGSLTDALRFCQYVSTRHMVTYLGLQWPSEDPRDHTWASFPNMVTRRVEGAGSPAARFQRWVGACIRECAEDYDVVYMYYFPGCSAVGLAHPSKKIVLDIRTASVSPSRVIRCFRNELVRLESYCFRSLSVVSEEVGSLLRFPRRKVHVLPLGGDRLDFHRPSTGLLHLLYIGTFTGRRLEDTIEGVSRFCEARGDRDRIHYTLVGDGPNGERETLTQLAARLGVSSALTFAGFVAQDELSPYLEWATVGLSYVPITSYFTCQPPTKTFEYLLSGLPVIATATDANRRLISPDTGVLSVDTPEALCSSLETFSKRQHTYDPDVIRNSVAAHSWENIMLQNAIPYLERVAAS